MEFREWLKQERKKHRLSQRELARLTGVYPVTIGASEHGKTLPNKNTKDKLEKFFNQYEEGCIRRKRYLCPCGLESHEDDSVFCRICGRKLLTEGEMAANALRNILNDALRCAPQAGKDRAREAILTACAILERGGG